MPTEPEETTAAEHGGGVETEAEPGRAREPAPDWWHRDHPTFTALSGFFTGLVLVILVPGAFAGILSAMFDQETVERLFPLVLLTLVVPLGLVLARRTRRFGTYFWIGMALTAIVVLGVAALVLWLMVTFEL